MYVVNYVEMARVTGVPIPFLISRGQQIKVSAGFMKEAPWNINYAGPVSGVQQIWASERQIIYS